MQAEQLRELETARIADSLKKIELEFRLSELKSTDNLKKEDLLRQLADVKIKDSLRILQQKQKIDSLRSFVKGYPVVPFLEDTLFFVYNRIGSFNPKERAASITGRIRNLANDYYFSKDSIKILISETSADLLYGDGVLMSISESDALWANTAKEILAQHYKDLIANSVTNYKNATSWQTILKQAGLAFLVVALLVIIIYFIGKLFRWTRKKIEAERNKRIKAVKLRNYELLNVSRLTGLYILINSCIKWLTIVTAAYFTLPILFSIFPWTKNFTGTLLSFFIDPAKLILTGIWNYLPNLFTIIVIVVVFRYVLKGIHFFKTEVEKGVLKLPGFYPDWANPTFQIIRALVYAFMLIVIFPYLPGSDSPVFQGVSVFLGVLFTFGSSGPLGNIIAGLVLTYMRSFKIGDRVKIGEITGDIIEKSILVTRIRTIKNEIISIPNGTVMGSHTVNFSSDAPERGLIVHTTVTIGYDVPWRQVQQLLIDAALATEFVEKQPLPFVLQTSLDDYYVSYQLNAYTKEPNRQALTYSQMHQNIQDKFNEAGVEIMSPHYKALRDGNATTIPSDHLPKDYIVPAFKVERTDKV